MCPHVPHRCHDGGGLVWSGAFGTQPGQRPRGVWDLLVLARAPLQSPRKCSERRCGRSAQGARGPWWAPAPPATAASDSIQLQDADAARLAHDLAGCVAAMAGGYAATAARLPLGCWRGPRDYLTLHRNDAESLATASLCLASRWPTACAHQAPVFRSGGGLPLQRPLQSFSMDFSDNLRGPSRRRGKIQRVQGTFLNGLLASLRWMPPRGLQATTRVHGCVSRPKGAERCDAVRGIPLPAVGRRGPWS